ncbi:hypothetical protein BLA29_004905 [Euroglyphus maynei]|uniref:Uncharacterized protein n=1 Tax=Euroglyphus maynei TaxID=6958 RepID=A0A1Y3AXM0_EURMA|nr:hypothetical protein BLA29_004905 [Euroglyphus maynei]
MVYTEYRLFYNKSGKCSTAFPLQTILLPRKINNKPITGYKQQQKNNNDDEEGKKIHIFSEI